MKNLKILIVIKTSIDFDGRVISQIDALADSFPKSQITIIYLADNVRTIEFPSNVYFKNIKLISRKLPKTRFWQLLKLIEYGTQTLLKIISIKPNIIHIHDESSILGPLLYSLIFFRKKTKIIYDDHELKNLRPKNIQERLMFWLENRIYKRADLCINANNDRLRITNFIHKPKKNVIIENWVYNRGESQLKEHTKNLINEIKEFKAKGIKILIHQGILLNERGLKLVQNSVKFLPEDWRLLLIGVPGNINESGLLKSNKILYRGMVFNLDIENIWKEMDAALIFYQNTTINNKYCAPNRLYIALNSGISLIVNEDNPVLSSTVDSINNGVKVSEKHLKDDLQNFFSNFSYFRKKSKTTIGQYQFQKDTHPIIQIYNGIQK